MEILQSFFCLPLLMEQNEPEFPLEVIKAGLIFTSNALVHRKVLHSGSLLALLVNIRLAWKLAKGKHSSLICLNKEKSIIPLTPGFLLRVVHFGPLLWPQ